MRLRPPFLLVALLATATVDADGLADMRACMAKLAARDPIRATVTIAVRKAPGEKDAKTAGERPPASVAVEAAAGPDGLTITVPPALLAALREQKPNTGGKKSARAVDESLREVRPDMLDGRLDAGRVLLSGLSDATLVSDVQSTYQGAPARLLTLRLDPGLSEEDRKHVKQMTAEMKIWLDPDACPRASETTIEMKARFMLIGVEAHQRKRQEFARVGDRLVMIADESEERSSGLGQNEGRTVTITVAPHGAASPAAAPAKVTTETPVPTPTGQPASR